MNLSKPTKLVIAFIFLLVVTCIGIGSGQISISLSDFLRGDISEQAWLAISQFRIPRVLICVLLGSGLAVASVVIQSIVGNDLAEPGILGLNSASTCFVILYVLIFSTKGISSVIAMPALAFVGGMLAMVIVMGLSWQRGNSLSGTRLVLTGAAINIGFNGLTLLLTTLLDRKQFTFVQIWMAGGIFGDNWNYVLALLPIVLIICGVLLYQSKYLNVFRLDETLQIGLGAPVKSKKIQLIVLAVFLAGSCSALGGVVSFVGILAPHISRRLIGTDHRNVIPMSMFIGATFLVLADAVGRTILPSTEIPTGIIVSIVGAPYFLFLFSRKRSG